MKTNFFKVIPTLIPQEKLPNAHKLVKRLFSSGQIPNVQIARKLKHFVKLEELLTKDQGVLENVKGYKISFLSQSLQQQLLRESHLNLKEKSVVAEEIGNLLKNIAIEKVHMKKVSAKSQFVTNLFLVKKKDLGSRPVHQFEESNPVHPTPTFQNEEFAITEIYPQANQLYVQIESKRRIFLNPTCGGVEEICEILLGGGPIWNLCLCFGIAPANFYVFTKLLKIPIAFLRRISTLIIIYLDDMLLIGTTAENVQINCNTVILTLQ